MGQSVHLLMDHFLPGNWCRFGTSNQTWSKSNSSSPLVPVLSPILLLFLVPYLGPWHCDSSRHSRSISELSRTSFPTTNQSPHPISEPPQCLICLFISFQVRASRFSCPPPLDYRIISELPSCFVSFSWSRSLPSITTAFQTPLPEWP